MMPMCILVISKSDLSAEQKSCLENRFLAEEHKNDKGPPQVWRVYMNGLYAIIQKGSGKPIGAVEASGPKDCVNPGWWLDNNFRGMGYGNRLVDTLAAYLKDHGYTGVGEITIETYQNEYSTQSQKLADRFRAHFKPVRNS